MVSYSDLHEAEGEDGEAGADGGDEVEVKFQDADAVRQVVDALLGDAILCCVGCVCV